MADTTPKPLSMEEMLLPLRRRLATLQSEIQQGQGHIARWEGYKADGAVQWANERIASMTEAVEERQTELTALESVAVILKVLNHPKFEGISHHWEALKHKFFNVVLLDQIGDHRGHVGDTVLEALLKAHDAIKAPKEVSADGQTPDVAT